mmetsp:Transcript_6606/g.24019  ORF Transcript_6606/g.24019 Transcript_6606/m.24019 type:complete len:311 (+) Transcript_6606:721-1653(+)
MRGARSLHCVGLFASPLASLTTTFGAAVPRFGIAGGWDKFINCATGSNAPRLLVIIPCKSLPPTKSSSNNTSTVSATAACVCASMYECTATTAPREPNAGWPLSPTITTRSPSSKSPPAYRSTTAPCVTGRMSNSGDTPSKSINFGALAPLALVLTSVRTPSSVATTEDDGTRGRRAIGCALSHALAAFIADKRAFSGSSLRASSRLTPSRMSSTASTALNTHACARLYSSNTRSASWLYSQPAFSPCVGRQNPATHKFLPLCFKFKPRSTRSPRLALAFSCTQTAPVIWPTTFGCTPNLRASSPPCMYL